MTTIIISPDDKVSGTCVVLPPPTVETEDTPDEEDDE